MSTSEIFSKNDLLVIEESLKYSRLRIEDSKAHASYEQKQEKLNVVNEVANKVSALLKTV